MTKQDALDHIREHLTKLHANQNIYEDGMCDLILALEGFVVPMLEKDIEQDHLMKDIFDNNPHAFDRVNVITSRELKCALGQTDAYCFDPAYIIDKDGNMQIKEISLVRKL